jgi:hypothetical protein
LSLFTKLHLPAIFLKKYNWDFKIIISLFLNLETLYMCTDTHVQFNFFRLVHRILISQMLKLSSNQQWSSFNERKQLCQCLIKWPQMNLNFQIVCKRCQRETQHRSAFWCFHLCSRQVQIQLPTNIY